MSGQPNWTEKQGLAITRADGALLVSAAAGSGKTAVLAARCVHLVCTAEKPCDIDQLLVLTFTRAAAGEMRERIERELRRHVEQQDEPRLQRQLRLIDRATITTLDGFCASLVRANFHLLGIDPGFAILAPEDAVLLKGEVAERLLDIEYDSPRATSLKALLDSYFGGDDQRLRSHLFAIHALLQSVVDPAQWRQRAVTRLSGGADGTDAELLDRFAGMQRRILLATQQTLASARRIAAGDSTLDAYVKHVDHHLAELNDWIALADARKFGELATRVTSFEVPRLPAVKQAPPDVKATAQALITAAKDDMKPGGDAHALCRWTLTQLRADLARTAPHATYLLDLAGRFSDAYDAAKRELRTLDFADTERFALTLLRETPETLVPSVSASEMQAKFGHVLVDEYQDINPLQNAILRLVSRDIAAEADRAVRSNFFAVGDVKQSIYRFRLAEPQQFIDRQATLREADSIGGVIDLQENFRSRGPLLEAINDVFRLLMTKQSTGIDYDATHELRSILPYPDFGAQAFTGKPIELHLLPRERTLEASDIDEEDDSESFEREIALVARRIRELIAEKRVVGVKEGGTLVPREIRYGDIAVLLRSAKFKASTVADELRAAGIPVHAEDNTGFFNNTEVQDVLALLRLVANGQQDIPMAAFLRSPLANLASPEDALATIRHAAPRESFHVAARLYARTVEDDLAKQLTERFVELDQWRRRFNEQPIGETLSQLLEETGYLTFCRALPDGAQRVANLLELRDRAGTFDAFERQGLDRFLAFLEELEADDQLGRPSIASASQDCVRVITVHKSKGLEFPVVIIPDLGKQFNEQSLKSPILIDRDLGLGLVAVDLPNGVRYPSLASMVIKDHARRQAIAEDVRVLYVALTRAREHLILIGSAKSPLADIADDWSNHTGALSDAHIQRARTALDWIAPIAVLTGSRGLGTFEVHDWFDKAPPGSFGAARGELPAQALERSFKAARNDAGAPNDSARQVIEQVSFVYPNEAATREPATRRISELKTLVPSETGGSRIVSLEWPAANEPRKRAGAMEIGTATHRFLEVLDVRRMDSIAELQVQAQEFVARRLLNESETNLIDFDAVRWLAETDFGQLIRDSNHRLFREQSIAFPLQPTGLTESDCVLVRGRLDVMLSTPNGLILADYKTDRVDAATAPARAEAYWAQLGGYAEAVAKITGQPILRASLVFLQARQIIDLPAARLANHA